MLRMREVTVYWVGIGSTFDPKTWWNAELFFGTLLQRITHDYDTTPILSLEMLRINIQYKTRSSTYRRRGGGGHMVQFVTALCDEGILFVPRREWQVCRCQVNVTLSWTDGWAVWRKVCVIVVYHKATAMRVRDNTSYHSVFTFPARLTPESTQPTPRPERF